MGVPSSAAMACCTRSTNAPLPSPYTHKSIVSLGQTLYHFILRGKHTAHAVELEGRQAVKSRAGKVENRVGALCASVGQHSAG